MSEDYEIVQMPRTKATCGLCEEYAKREASKPVVVLACEGACLRGELARLTANLLCDELAPEKTARLCLGGAFTKDTGQRRLAREASRVIAIEGCPIDCGSRMMKGVLPQLTLEVFRIPDLTRFDASLFSVREMPEQQRKVHAAEAAREITEKL
jgi:uncharacterized metal-binding protein